MKGKGLQVLVDALPARHGGGAEYVVQQLSALAALDSTTEYHTLLSPWADIDGLPGTVETVPVRSVPTRFAYELARIPFRSMDLLYCPLNFAPLAAKAPIVLTLHNANYYGRGLELPEVAASRPIWKVKANHWAIKRADAIVVISESLAAAVAETMPGIATKMHVIQSGSPVWPEVSTPVSGLSDGYVLSVASAAPHKRVDDVIEGWAKAAHRLGVEAPPLVLVGAHTDGQMARHLAIAGPYRDQLVHLGLISKRSELKWIYEHASAMVSMSLLEAFPLTPSEAGSVGCPLVLSDIPAHRETTLGHAAFVPVRDTDALATVLVQNASSVVARSQPWRWPISWDDNARELATLFESVVSKRRAQR